ncbi:MAG: hypothetical protein LUQ16_08900 [Methanomassiliicoccales archaeon]|jgi:hypothetical protein|nr:hypothetical protein [Methanomassiliicoccales archaeon]MDD1755986.1 hypothetical protein [Methanomassiliicoccales archaeon]
MEYGLKQKFKTELRSFFGLTILNLMIGAMMLALGISLAVTHLLGMVDAGRIDPLSVLLVGLGAMAIGAGFYWIIEIAEIIDGVDDLRTAYEGLDDGDQDHLTGLSIKMMAYYRSNKSTISRMIMLGRIGGGIFLILGALGVIGAGSSIASSGILLENTGQLVGGVIAFGVGIAGLLVSRYFSIYARLWDARLHESAKIEDALEHELEAK